MNAAGGAALAGLHILVVEDEMMLAMALGDLLEAIGCRVDTAPGVERALTKIEQESFDGALLDVNLNGGRVYRVAAELARRDIPFVFMTGYDASILEEPWCERPIVHKPFSLDALERVAASAFARR